MNPDEVEQMLYEHAIRTKIRAPFSERLSNWGYGRVFSSGIVGGAALIFSLVMSKSTNVPFGSVPYNGLAHPHMIDNSNIQATNFHQQGVESVPGSLAMSAVGE